MAAPRLHWKTTQQSGCLQGLCQAISPARFVPGNNVSSKTRQNEHTLVSSTDGIHFPLRQFSLCSSPSRAEVPAQPPFPNPSAHPRIPAPIPQPQKPLLLWAEHRMGKREEPPGKHLNSRRCPSHFSHCWCKDVGKRSHSLPFPQMHADTSRCRERFTNWIHKNTF